MTIVNAIQLDNYLTPAQAAKYFGVTAKTINRWADDGLIPTVRTSGQHRRYLLSEVLAFREKTTNRVNDG